MLVLVRDERLVASPGGQALFFLPCVLYPHCSQPLISSVNPSVSLPDCCLVGKPVNWCAALPVCWFTSMLAYWYGRYSVSASIASRTSALLSTLCPCCRRVRRSCSSFMIWAGVR